jgi:hypothetical protein
MFCVHVPCLLSATFLCRQTRQFFLFTISTLHNYIGRTLARAQVESQLLLLKTDCAIIVT